MVAREMALYVSDVPADEDFRDARAGLFGLHSLRAGMFRDVRHCGLARRMAQEGEMKLRVFFCLVASVLLTAPARAGGLALSPQAQKALDHIYSGDPDAGIAAARGIERA